MKRKKLIWLMAAALTLSLVPLSSAVWDEDEAVHVDLAEIEASTLALGTHLIHLSALTDSIYEVARQSAEESGQSDVFYKSELAAGTWFNITASASLEDITTAGTPVADSVIAALFFTHHTKSDGVTYDLRTGLPVDPRDIRSPYDLESMEELFPLKTQYDLLQNTQSENGAGKEKAARAEQFFATPVTTDVTDSCDMELKYLRAYYDVLNQNEAGVPEKNAVQGVMDALDASRRAEVFRIVEEALSAYLEEISTVPEEDEGGSAAPDTSLQSAISDSLNSVRSSRLRQEGKMLDIGTTTVSTARYDYSRALIDDAAALNHAACDVDTANLVTLDNIVNGAMTDRAAELAMLEGELIPASTDTYTGGVRAGQNAEYNAAVGQNSAQVLLRNITKDNVSLLNSYRNELEFFLTAKIDRQSPGDAGTYVDSRLDLTKGWYSGIPADAFHTGAAGTIDAHVEYLTRLKRKLELGAGGNELDALAAKKAELQTDMMSCLDRNDLAGAKALEQQIAGVDGEIQALTGAFSAELTALNSRLGNLQRQMDEALSAGDEAGAETLDQAISTLKAEATALSASMPDGTLGAQTAQLRQAGISAVNAGDGAAAGDTVNALGGLLSLDYGLVFPALKDLHAAMSREKNLNGDNSFDSALAATEDIILNNADAYAAALRTKQNSDSLEKAAANFFAARGKDNGLLGAGNAADLGGSGDTGAIPGNGSGASVSDFTGPGQESGAGGKEGVTTSPTGNQVGGGDLDSRFGDPAIELIALAMYNKETGNRDAYDRIQFLALRESQLGNPLVFLRVDDAGQEYLPLPTLAAYTGMRYVWNRTQSLGTLARGAEYYGFVAYAHMVKRGRDGQAVDEMASSAKFQNGVIHVHESYTYPQFGAEALYLSDTGYGVLCDEFLMEGALALFGQLLG